MFTVAAALIPGVIALVWLYGWGVVVNLTLASATAVLAEALVLHLRKRPLAPFLSDGSAIVTALLLGAALPPLLPWWMTVIGVLFAVVVAKHLYGGLGFNPFNPAMVGYAVLLISFPKEMSTWAAPLGNSGNALGLIDSARMIFLSVAPSSASIDMLTGASPLDALRTQLGLERTVEDIIRGNTLRGLPGVSGYEVINLAFLLGGVWLIYKRVIGWQIPVGMISTMVTIAAISHWADPAHYASPLFHILSGATMLGAFFIATDPVTAATSPRGRLIYGAGIGVLTYVIRAWGGYPDGVAFAVLLMNIAAPTIDYYTKPRVFGDER
jgi:electron transport complex protein RnfD